MTDADPAASIVDDHPVVREGTAALLAAQPGIEVVGTAGSIDEATALIAGVAADVLLLDIRLGTDSGLRLLTETAPADGGPAIIVLTSYDYPQYAEAALRLGASGFVLKTAPIAELLDAIRRVAAGGLAFSIRPRAGGGLARLSERELDVVRLVVDGRSNDEIGGPARDRPEDGRVAPAPPVRAVRPRLAHGARDARPARGLAGGPARRPRRTARGPWPTPIPPPVVMPGSLAAAIAIGLVVLVVELLAGLAANSLALLADAGHVFADVSGMALSLVAIRLAARPPTGARSFGLYRLEMLAAAANAVLLLLIAAVIVVEAVRRFVAPPDVQPGIVVLVAAGALLANFAVAADPRAGPAREPDDARRLSRDRRRLHGRGGRARRGARDHGDRLATGRRTRVTPRRRPDRAADRRPPPRERRRPVGGHAEGRRPGRRRAPRPRGARA